MPKLTVASAGESATVTYTLEPVEPTGPGLTSISALGAGTLNKRMDLLPAGNGITLPPGAVSDPDMNYPPNYPVYCFYLAKPTKILGSGRDVSVLEVRAESLTQAYRKLDDIVEPDTNPYRVVRVDKASLVQDLTIRGTFQGMSAKTSAPYSFHGLQFFATQDPTLRNVRLQDVSGSRGVPPDETFSVEAYRCSGTFTLDDVIIDGPTLQGSSGVTVNNTPAPLGVIMRRVSMTGHPNGSLWTTFNTKLSSFLAEDCSADGATCGFNFEHVTVNGGAPAHNEKDAGIVLVRPDIRNPSDKFYPGAYSHLAIDASAAGGGVSNRVDIHDPVGVSTSNPFGVTISAGYGYANVPSGTQAQRGADVHLWIGETERSDLLYFRRTHGAP